MVIDDRGDGSTTRAMATVKFTAADLDIAPKDYEFAIDVKDISDGGRYQPAGFGKIRVSNSPA